MSQTLNGFYPSSPQAKGNFRESLKRAGVLFISGLLGGIAGSAAGRWALPASLLSVYTGTYLGEDALTMAGAGMFAGTAAISAGKGNSVQGYAVDGFKDEMDAGLQRARDFVQVGLKNSLWLDKFGQASPPEESANGLDVDVMLGLGAQESLAYPDMGATDYSGMPRFLFEDTPLAQLPMAMLEPEPEHSIIY